MLEVWHESGTLELFQAHFLVHLSSFHRQDVYHYEISQMKKECTILNKRYHQTFNKIRD